VLDLGCGPGRWAIPLAKRGFRATGVDRTRCLLAQARAKARTAGARIEWIQLDMRDFVRPGAFDLAISMLTSFGYFDDKGEDLVVLRNIFTSLRPGGACLIDVAGKEILARIYQPTTSNPLQGGGQLVQRHEVFDGWSRVRNEWILIRHGRTRTFKFHHTIYSGQELRERLEQVGFKNVKLYGDLNGGAYGVNAQRLVVVGRKPIRSGRSAAITKATARVATQPNR
jgi:SAM-dependent methyltransferase